MRPCLEELESRFQPAVLDLAGGVNLIAIDPSSSLFRLSVVSPPEQATGSGSSSSGSTPSSSASSSSSTTSAGARPLAATVLNYFDGFGVGSSAGGIGTVETPGDALIPNYVFQFGSNASTGVLFKEAANSIPNSSLPPLTALLVPPTANPNILQQAHPQSLTAPLVYGDSEIPEESEEGEPLPSPEEDKILENPLSTTQPQGQEPSSLAPVQPPTGKDSASLPREDAFALPDSLPPSAKPQEAAAAGQRANFWSSISSNPKGSLLETAAPAQEEPRMDWNNTLLGAALAVVPAWAPSSDNPWKENREA